MRPPRIHCMYGCLMWCMVVLRFTASSEGVVGVFVAGWHLKYPCFPFAGQHNAQGFGNMKCHCMSGREKENTSYCVDITHHIW